MTAAAADEASPTRHATSSNRALRLVIPAIVRAALENCQRSRPSATGPAEPCRRQQVRYKAKGEPPPQRLLPPVVVSASCYWRMLPVAGAPVWTGAIVAWSK